MYTVYMHVYVWIYVLLPSKQGNNHPKFSTEALGVELAGRHTALDPIPSTDMQKFC